MVSIIDERVKTQLTIAQLQGHTQLTVAPLQGPTQLTVQPVQRPDGFGVRHTLAFLGFLAFSSCYAMRINLSVAIVAMVNKTQIENSSAATACPLPEDYDPGEHLYTDGEFDWDSKTQGIILGAFFYGYALTNYIGGRAAEYWGGRMVVGWGIVLTGILTMVSPFAARYSTGLFIAVRILEGCAEGVTFPGMNTMIADYYPIEERSKFASFIYLGVQFGTVVSLPVSGLLADTNFLGGWPSVFYIFGGLGIVWGAFWFYLIHDDPRQHPRISDSELTYILKGCQKAGQRKDYLKVPWRSVFTSRPFWALAIMHFSNNWGFYTLLTELPTYLDQILHFNIKSNGALSAAPYLGAWLFGMAYGKVTDVLLVKKSMSILSVRRLGAVIGCYGPMLSLILMCFVNCHSMLALVILILGGTGNGGTFCAHMLSHADIAPRFAGTLMGITNTLATVPGFVSPLVTGIITEDNQTLWAWRTVFLISAVIYGIGTTCYIVFISADVQTWNYPPPIQTTNANLDSSKVAYIRDSEVVARN